MVPVCIRTRLGDILAEIYDEQAPRTAAHFLRYVDEGHYNDADASFFRTARADENQPTSDYQINVIEGGFCNEYYAALLKASFDTGEPYDDAQGHIAPRTIRVEPTGQTGLRHRDGTLSIGRTDPDSVDDSIVVCIGDNPHLDQGGKRHPDGYGFPAFGRVTRGMDILRGIHQAAAEGQCLADPVEILSIKRVEGEGR